MTDYISTASDRKMNYLDPDPDQVNLGDIAHGLAMNCRFGGQCQIFYSVAMHSIHVSKELEARGYSREVQLYGLLHDAAEAYTGDVPHPLKKELEQFDDIEEGILDAIWTAFGIEPPSQEDWKKVKEADNVLLHYEGSEILPNGEWKKVDRDFILDDSSPEDDKERFRERFEELVSTS